MNVPRWVPFVGWLLVAWCVMVMTHESGHVLAGWATGGTLQHADLAPWSLPHSHFDPDPQPLVTAWGGPLLGVLVPLLIAWMLRWPPLWFIATFCLVANGSYLAIAWVTGEQYLDTARLLRHGASPWSIGVYCAVTLTTGYLGFRQACMRMLAPPEPEPPSEQPPVT